jgi:HAD superfamily hydrolase (TIGR01509 family)
MGRLSAVILDLDGLILDTERVARRAWRRAAAEQGYTIDDSLYTRIIGRTPSDTEDILVAALGSGFPYRGARRCQERYMSQAIEQGELESKPGLDELLRTIEDLKLKRAIATSSHRTSAVRKLSAAGMEDAFETIVCGDDVVNGKPAPDIFFEAADRLGLAPDCCVVLEDSDPGARAAYSAGMRVIVVPDLKQPTEETWTVAWRVLPSLYDAAQFLTTAWQNRA